MLNINSIQLNPEDTVCFPHTPLPMSFLLTTSEEESFSTGNFVTGFILLNEELEQNKKVLKFTSWVT